MADKFIRFTLRLSKEEMQKIEAESKKNNMKKAEVIRHIINAYNGYDLELIREHKKNINDIRLEAKSIGNLLNQIARKINKGELKNGYDYQKELEEIWQLLKQ